MKYRKTNDSRRKTSDEYGARYSDIKDSTYRVNVRSKNDYEPKEHDKVSEQTTFLVEKSMRGLRENTVMIAGDPYQDKLAADTPYAYLAAPNRLMGVNYKGVPNILGNVMFEINDPSNAMNLQHFDAAFSEIVMNWQFINRPSDVSQFMNEQYGKALEQVISQVDAELVRDLTFLTDTWQTNMTNIDPDNRFAAIAFYESALMNAITPVQGFNTILALQPTLMKMCFLREAVHIKALYSQLCKTTFIENVNGILTDVPGEYLDMNWFNMVTTVIANPSRKANDKFNPIKSLNATHWMPTLTEIRSGVTVFDSTSLVETAVTTAFGTKTYNMQTLASDINKLLAPGQILAWARQYGSGQSSVTPKQYANDLDTLFQAMARLMTTFSQSVGPIRTFFDRMKKTAPNIINLTNGWGFAAGKVKNFEMRNNVLVNDIMAGIVAGPNDLTYNTEVKAWVFHSLWDKYYGLPEFDCMSGGFFLTSSVRDIPARSGGETGTEAKYAIPRMFTHPGEVKLVNMAGDVITVVRQTMQDTDVIQNNKFARLFLTTDSTFDLNVAYFDWAQNALDPIAVSWLSYAMVDLFSFSHQHRDDTIWIGDNTVDDYDCENSAMGGVDLQSVSIANSLRTYARSMGPVRLQVLPADAGGVGFSYGAGRSR